MMKRNQNQLSVIRQCSELYFVRINFHWRSNCPSSIVLAAWQRQLVGFGSECAANSNHIRYNFIGLNVVHHITSKCKCLMSGILEFFVRKGFYVLMLAYRSTFRATNVQVNFIKQSNKLNFYSEKQNCRRTLCSYA